MPSPLLSRFENTGPRPSLACYTNTTAKLKLKLEEINQNPFRYSLLDSAVPVEDGGGSGGGNSDGGDTSEDMSWGFDQTFFGEEGDNNDDDPDDYDDI